MPPLSQFRSIKHVAILAYPGVNSLDAARRALEESSRPLTRVSRECGFGHAETMRRVCIRHLNVAPHDYRRRFRAALAG